MAKKVLIIDDDAFIRKMFSRVISENGFEIATAKNGNQAIDMLKKDDYDLILLDLVMPDGDGFGFLERLQEKSIKTPVFVISNLGDLPDKELAMKLGAKEYFEKATSSAALVAKSISMHLKKSKS